MYYKTLTIPLLSLVSLFILLIPEKDPAISTKLDAGFAQCHITTQKFAALGNDQSFVDFHKDPVPFDFQNREGEMITYAVAGGKDANAYFIKSTMPSDEYLVIFHEWYGLNAYVKNEAEKFAAQFNEMNVLALDLYDGQVAENSETARNLMQEVQTERALAIINGAERFAGDDARIFTVGWCFGGGWSLQAAIEFGDQAEGAIMFYGMPEQDIERLKQLECDVLGIFAENDNWITPEVVAKFENKMEQIAPDLILETYKASHGFANPGNPDFKRDMAADAYKRMYEFIEDRR